MITLDQVETDLKNYKLTHQPVIIQKANTIGFNGVPGKNIPVLPLASFASISGTNGRNVMGKIKGSDPIQLGQTGVFNPKNFGEISTRSYMSEPAKADEKYIDFEIQQMYDTYLQRVNRAEFDAEEIPFIQVILEAKFESIEHYIRRAFFLASKNHAAANGGNSTTLFNGWIKQIADDILLTSGQQVKEKTITALTASNALDQIALLYGEIPNEDFLKDSMVCFMSLPQFRAYKANYEDKYKYVLKPDENGIVALHDTNNIVINVEASWTNQPMITPIGNLHASIDYNQLSQIDSVHDKLARTINFVQDFKVGAGIADLTKVYQAVTA